MKSIYIETFGRFAVFIDGQPLLFKNLKAKELLAYLIDNEGDFVSNKDIITTLWKNRINDMSLKRSFRYTLRLLRDAFNAEGIDDLFDVGYGVVKINRNRITCDYYEFIKGNTEAYPYKDDYMYGYEWAESTRRRIEERQSRSKSNK